MEDISLMFKKARDNFVGAPIFLVLDGSVALPQILLKLAKVFHIWRSVLGAWLIFFEFVMKFSGE